MISVQPRLREYLRDESTWCFEFIDGDFNRDGVYDCTDVNGASGHDCSHDQ